MHKFKNNVKIWHSRVRTAYMSIISFSQTKRVSVRHEEQTWPKETMVEATQ